MDGTAGDSSWNPHARMVWGAYYSSDRSECPPAPYIAPRALPDLTPPFSPDESYETPVECALHPIFTDGHLMYCATDDSKCWVSDAPIDEDPLDEDHMEQDATCPLMHVLNLRFAYLPEQWDVQLTIRRLERGATVKAVLFAIDHALRKPSESNPLIRRVDELQSMSNSDRWRVRIQSAGDDEFTVFVT